MVTLKKGRAGIIRLGALRHLISIYTPTRVSDNMGGTTRTPTLLGQVRAAVRTRVLEERSRASELQDVEYIEVTIRVPFLFTIAEGDYIVYESENYYIEVIDRVDHLNRFYLLKCRKGASL